MTDLRRDAVLHKGPDGDEGFCQHRGRAFGKLALIFLVVAMLIAALSYFISERDLETLKHALSLWTLIALVIVINLVSFGCFIAMAAAWQWVRRDLKAPREEDELDV